MGSLLEAKVLGIVGSVLVLFTMAPYAGPLLGMVGTGMILLAVRNISKTFQKKSIFVFMIASLSCLIIALAVALITANGIFVQSFQDGPIVEGAVLLSRLITMGPHLSLEANVMETAIISWAFLIAAALFGMSSYRKIASVTNVNLFRKVGQFYLYGSLTLIILIGFFFIIVAQMILMAAFLWLPRKKPNPSNELSAPRSWTLKSRH